MLYGDIRKTVTFKLDNPEERAMYQLIVSQTSFSKLVKGYLREELNRMRAAQAQRKDGQ